jgi:preprotein translocase subunit SecG
MGGLHRAWSTTQSILILCGVRGLKNIENKAMIICQSLILLCCLFVAASGEKPKQRSEEQSTNTEELQPTNLA